MVRVPVVVVVVRVRVGVRVRPSQVRRRHHPAGRPQRRRGGSGRGRVGVEVVGLAHGRRQVGRQAAGAPGALRRARAVAPKVVGGGGGGGRRSGAGGDGRRDGRLRHGGRDEGLLPAVCVGPDARPLILHQRGLAQIERLLLLEGVSPRLHPA